MIEEHRCLLYYIIYQLIIVGFTIKTVIRARMTDWKEKND